MIIKQEKLNGFISLIHKIYPGWEGFSDSRFVEEEVDYKHATIKKAHAELSEVELQRLIEESKFDEFITRLDKIAKDNNLLWRAVPKSGDLNILYQSNLDKSSFSKAVFNLLYGTGSSNERLGHYLDYVKANKLPNKWTFPTYFMFICHPKLELFVKPQTIQWLLRFFNIQGTFSSIPTMESYATIKKLAKELKDALQNYHPKNMVDIQGVIYVAAKVSESDSQQLLAQDKRVEFNKLFKDFVKSYFNNPQGQKHLAAYEDIRQQGINNYKEIISTVEQGEDATEQVLLKLVPYMDSLSNKQKGAWIHIAPSVTGDLKSWYQSNGWAKPNDWPHIAQAILNFVRFCNDEPTKLSQACDKFSEYTDIKGFQTGMLTPILNALKPDEFILINNKSRKVINYFAGKNHSQSIKDYPATNVTANALIKDITDEMQQAVGTHFRPADLFDMFSHWLIGIKKYNFKDIHYWKIAPGEKAWQWEECVNNGFIGIGWDKMGDISKLDRAKFETRRDELIKKDKDWGTNAGVEQVWKFAHIKDGDQIIANRGTTEVLGIGTVTGPYFFIPGVKNGHRLPVEWDDLTPRKVDKGGWRKALIELERADFEAILNAEHIEDVVEPNPDCPFSNKTFELLAGLTDDPTKEYYQEYKDDFIKHLEEPFKQLFLNAGKALQPKILNLMEINKRIFSRIPKNDFGQGGAWDYYWGAFYPKNGSRTSDAQLFLWMNSERAEFGFNIGEYGSDQLQRFIRNCQENKEVLAGILNDSLSDEELVIGRIEKGKGKPNLSWKDWLSDPAEYGINVTMIFSRDKVLQYSYDDLSSQIKQTFEKLFPLVLLATSDDPMSDIADYLGSDDEIELNPEYSLAQCAEETNINQEILARWVRAIARKRQAIIYGPPGTGKTYLAERLAKHLVSGGEGICDIVQFHPAYAYEDFIQGIRPQTRPDGGLHYPLVPGRFLEFCRKAASHKGKSVLIIDEINRANLSRVFGELMYLLEYRQEKVPLASGGNFSIPDNVYLIGTMNTADRSIALVDHALRRRFAFLALYPNYDVLREYHNNTGFQVEGLIETLVRLNKEISDRHYEVGVSFFLREDLSEQIEDIWTMEIEPYLEEYFFDQQDKVDEFRWDKIKGKIDQ